MDDLFAIATATGGRIGVGQGAGRHDFCLFSRFSLLSRSRAGTAAIGCRWNGLEQKFCFNRQFGFASIFKIPRISGITNFFVFADVLNGFENSEDGCQKFQAVAGDQQTNGTDHEDSAMDGVEQCLDEEDQKNNGEYEEEHGFGRFGGCCRSILQKQLPPSRGIGCKANPAPRPGAVWNG